MERDELLEKLAKERFAYYESIGLPPFKCRQVVNESLEEGRKLSVERLRELLEEGHY
jgi:hypothetical protein